MAELTVLGMSVISGVTLCLAAIHAGAWHRDRRDVAERHAALLAGAMTLVAFSAIALYQSASVTAAVYAQRLQAVAILSWWLVYFRATRPTSHGRAWNALGVSASVLLFVQLFFVRTGDRLVFGMPGGESVRFATSPSGPSCFSLLLVWAGVVVPWMRLAAGNTRATFVAVLALTGLMARDCLFHLADPVAGMMIEQAAWLILAAATWRVSFQVRSADRADGRTLELLKRTEEDLRNSEAKWRSMAENSPDHIVIMDSDLRVVYINRIGGEGMASDEASGPWGDFLAPRSYARACACYQRVLATARPSQFEAEYITSREDRFFLDVRVTPITRDTEIVGIALSCRNITAAKQMEEALRAGEERFRLAFEEGPVGRFIAAIDGRFTQVNPAFCRLLRYTADEILGTSWIDVIPLRQRPDLREQGARLFRGEIDSFQVEKTLVPRGGREIVCRLTICAMRDRGDRVSAMLGMVEDISKQREAEITLRRAERLASVGTLAAGIAHEVNNPLQGIVFYAETAMEVLRAEGDADRLRDAIRKVQSEAFRCGKIVKGILQFSRDEPTPKARDSFAEMARRAAEMMRPMAETQEVDLRIETPEADVPVRMNRIELEQVVANLIANAVHASEAGKEVRVRVEADDSEARLLVIDDGCGMSEEQMARMFEPFYTTRQQEGGTGLGLSLTYGIVEEHGGRLAVRSQVGQGTTVTATFPLEREREDDDSTVPTPTPAEP